ncbi:MAG: hypothetical protein K0R94_948 [Burkholderiales bacterium]|jgi:hypothetical protein|nr:hypothetical protein [Burkholderiales bacterium]
MNNFKLKCTLLLIICSSVIYVFAQTCVRTVKCTVEPGVDEYYVCRGSMSQSLWMTTTQKDITNNTTYGDASGWCNETTALQYGNLLLKARCQRYQIIECTYKQPG